ncbi:UNVERIFIED_CONTAM: hypothetical protein HDU68_012732 [Siphonaria sp. JEL0065]|nr:hypothetical protein HDU68_012732 [Siphonaria sp. JEL0065]
MSKRRSTVAQAFYFILPKKKSPKLLPTLLTTIVLVLATCTTSIHADSSSLAASPAIPSPSSNYQPQDCSLKFIPSTEWKVIHAEECVPPGLHIRINFETGVKEAKLKDSDEGDQVGSAVSIPVVQKEDGEGGKGYTIVKEPKKVEKPKAYGDLLAETLTDDELTRHLTFLEEEVSDIEEGVRLMETRFLRHRLVSILATHPKESIRSIAARVYAGAVSNNLMAQQAALDTVDTLLAAVNKNPPLKPEKAWSMLSHVLFVETRSPLVCFGSMEGDRRVQNKIKDLVNDLFDVEMLVDGSIQDEEGLELMAKGGFCDGSVSDDGIDALCKKALALSESEL